MSVPTFNFKIVLLGDSGVGKSCLVVKFVKDEFFIDNPPTLGGISRKNIISFIFVADS